MVNVNLFCIPFAGGNRYSFLPLEKAIGGSLTTVPLDYPGRGTRYGEPLLKRLDVLCNDLFNQLTGKLQEPYAIYGHSMGGLLTYLLTKKIREEQLPLPVHLFISGSRAPSMRRDMPDYHKLPRPQFIEKLRSLGGTTDEILNSSEILELYEPILRADFEAVETYEYEPCEPFNIPVTVFNGLSDRISREQAEAWQRETTLPIVLREFPGDHFFILEHTTAIASLIVRNVYAGFSLKNTI
ncbi:thioesterase II family protein [Chitinophaga sp. CF418]|uniref:thioesterase II family protein n=1 Tax=Chitinophaga sp. CF418 TaxID=1855287 RepID=UPI0009116D59|nr:alpha/beta fold hydrolase [Chitinophaga sp. CF418]SHN76706.1 Surfactin synthase thioesterase subunit [Chitinophaga sp. CF418]